MRILHLCSYYIGNKLYKNMVETLDEKGIQQDIYIPIRSKNHINRNITEKKNINIEYHYDLILEKKDKFLYKNKIKKQTRNVEQKVLKHKNIKYIHAHTVFSDGGVAYEIKKKYGIDYLVTFRNTDINSFYKYALHLRPYMYKILKNASKIVFISEAYKKQVIELLPQTIKEKVESKFIVLPNGISQFWHENSLINKKKSFNEKHLRLLFIGELNYNKNISSVIKAVKRLSSDNNKNKVTLNIVGKGPLEKELKQEIFDLNSNCEINFHGFISSPKKLLDVMRGNDIFIMPSHKESFGLVYVEAMSQGLPIIYTKNQGFDGFYTPGIVGYPVNSKDVNNIVEAIKKVSYKYKDIYPNCLKYSKEFNWTNIVLNYIRIYNRES